jgi:hypothetical protein
MPASETLSNSVVAQEPARSTDLLAKLLEDFLDRGAARRFAHYAVSHAGYGWKPSLALVLPRDFNAARQCHLNDLTVALEVLASVMDQYHVAVVSDSSDALRLFRKVVPFSPEAISAVQGALVILSPGLNDEVSTICPSRYVAADPAAYRNNKKRIVFVAGGGELPFERATDCEVARDARGCVSVLLDEQDELLSFLEVLRRLQGRGVPIRVTLSSRADEDFGRLVRTAFANDPRVEIHDSEPAGLHDQAEFQISNDIISLVTQPSSTLPRFLFRRGELWRLGEPLPRRSNFYLFRGEESNSHGLLGCWIGKRDLDPPRPGSLSHRGTVEPLVSIVVSVYDRTAEIIRLARSVYEQDYPWIEVVFVSNDSPPETLEAIRASENYLMKRRFRVRLIELAQACGSATIAQDVGIRASSGELICVLDSRDWLDPAFFAFLRQNPWRADTLYYPKRYYHDHGRAMGDHLPFDQALAGRGTLESAEFVLALRRHGNFLSNSGVCFSRELFDRAGGIDHRLSYNVDLYLWWRCALVGGRAQEQSGRVNISLYPMNNELEVGGRKWEEAACELARSQELLPWQ